MAAFTKGVDADLGSLPLPQLQRRNSIPETQLDLQSTNVLSVARSVVKVYCQFSAPVYNQPWQLRRGSSATSSGFVISTISGEKFIICNAHGVSHFTSVSVKRTTGGNRKYIAKVLAIADTCDLALLSVDDPAFWFNLPPLPLLGDHNYTLGIENRDLENLQKQLAELQLQHDQEEAAHPSKDKDKDHGPHTLSKHNKDAPDTHDKDMDPIEALRHQIRTKEDRIAALSAMSAMPSRVDTVNHDGLPEINTTCFVCGFPVGGDEISFTSGVVSRIGINSYAHSGEQWLTVQTDSGINPGNSGGPVVSKNSHTNTFEAIGVAFETLTGGSGVGYLIGAPVVRNFIESYLSNNIGTPSLNVITQSIESQILRDSLFIPPLSGLLDYLFDCTSSAPAPPLDGEGAADKTTTAAPPIPSSMRDLDRTNKRRASLCSSQVHKAQHTTVDSDGEWDFVIFHPLDLSGNYITPPSMSSSSTQFTHHTPVYRFKRQPAPQDSSSSTSATTSKPPPPSQLLRYLHSDSVNDTTIGIGVASVIPFTESAKVLQQGDVILCINDIPVASDQTILLRTANLSHPSTFDPSTITNERVKYSYIISSLHIGDTVRLLIARGFDILSLEIPLEEKQYIAKWSLYCPPQYLVCQCLVFVPLTSNLMESEYGSSWADIGPVPLLDALFLGTQNRFHQDEEVVCLTQILSHSTSEGYDYSMRRVTHCNGERIINLKHLATIVNQAVKRYEDFMSSSAAQLHPPSPHSHPSTPLRAPNLTSCINKAHHHHHREYKQHQKQHQHHNQHLQQQQHPQQEPALHPLQESTFDVCVTDRDGHCINNLWELELLGDQGLLEEVPMDPDAPSNVILDLTPDESGRNHISSAHPSVFDNATTPKPKAKANKAADVDDVVQLRSPALGSLIDTTDDDCSTPSLSTNRVNVLSPIHDRDQDAMVTPPTIPPHLLEKIATSDSATTFENATHHFKHYTEQLQHEFAVKYLTFTLQNGHIITLSLENGRQKQLEILKLHQISIPGCSNSILPMYDIEFQVDGGAPQPTATPGVPESQLQSASSTPSSSAPSTPLQTPKVNIPLSFPHSSLSPPAMSPSTPVVRPALQPRGGASLSLPYESRVYTPSSPLPPTSTASTTTNGSPHKPAAVGNLPSQVHKPSSHHKSTTVVTEDDTKESDSELAEVAPKHPPQFFFPSQTQSPGPSSPAVHRPYVHQHADPQNNPNNYHQNHPQRHLPGLHSNLVNPTVDSGLDAAPTKPLAPSSKSQVNINASEDAPKY